MVIGNRANCIVQVEVIFEGRVVPSPPDHVIGRKLAFGLKHLADVFVENCPFLLFVLKPSRRVLEISGVCESICPDRPQLRQTEMMSKDLSYPSFDFPSNIN